MKRAILTQHSSQQQQRGERANLSRLDESLNASASIPSERVVPPYKPHDISTSSGENRERSGASVSNQVEAEARRKATLRKLLGDDDDDSDEEEADPRTSKEPKAVAAKSAPGTTDRLERNEQISEPAKKPISVNAKRTKPRLLPETDEEEDEEEEEDVPTTPPSKKFKSIFGFSDSQTQHSVKTLKSQASTGNPSATQREILAEDSEED